MTTAAANSPAPERKFSDAEIADFRHAAAQGKMDIVKAFVEAGMPVDAVEAGYSSHVPGYAIALAAEGGQLGIAKYLAERGAGEDARKAAFTAAIVNLHTAKHGGSSANSLAVAEGRDLAKTLLLGIPEGSTRDAAVANTRRQLSAPCSATLNEVLRAISFDSLLPRFHQAARAGDIGAVRACIAEGVHVDARERPEFPAALTQAARKGHVDVVEYLLSMRPRPEDRKEALTAIAFAIVITSEEVAKNRLIEAAKRILHSTHTPAQLKDALSNRLQQKGDHEAADALRSIRL
jgi:ankyrin repeat protein